MNYKKGLKPLNLALIQGLRDWKDLSTNGWKFMSEILRDAPNWKSQTGNFPKYMKELVVCGIVQQKDVMIAKKGRTVTKISWRLRQTVKAANLIKLALGMYYNKVYYNKQLSSKKDILSELENNYKKVSELEEKNKQSPQKELYSKLEEKKLFFYKYGRPFLMAGKIPDNMPDGSLIKDRGPYGFEYDRIMLKKVLQDNKNKDQIDIINAMLRLRANEHGINKTFSRYSEDDQKALINKLSSALKQPMKKIKYGGKQNRG